MALTKVTSGVRTLGTGEVVAANVDDDAVGIAELSATGTASATTFLRGDNSWQTAGVSTIAALTDATVSSSDPTISTNPAAVGHFWINSTSGESYVATDITSSANHWKNIGDGTGAVTPLSVQYLVVAGGGGGGAGSGGGAAPGAAGVAGDGAGSGAAAQAHGRAGDLSALGPLAAVSWPWVPAWRSLEPSRRGGENAQKTRKNGEEMGEIRPKTCEQGRDISSAV